MSDFSVPVRGRPRRGARQARSTVRYVGSVKYAKGMTGAASKWTSLGWAKTTARSRAGYFECKGGAKMGLLVRSNAVQSEDDAALSKARKDPRRLRGELVGVVSVG